jgi:hypothetical protein
VRCPRANVNAPCLRPRQPKCTPGDIIAVARASEGIRCPVLPDRPLTTRGTCRRIPRNGRAAWRMAGRQNSYARGPAASADWRSTRAFRRLRRASGAWRRCWNGWRGISIERKWPRRVIKLQGGRPTSPLSVPHGGVPGDGASMLRGRAPRFPCAGHGPFPPFAIRFNNQMKSRLAKGHVCGAASSPATNDHRPADYE